MTHEQWIGVDLDRTLAVYESGDLATHGEVYIGSPIPLMVARVQEWLHQGKTVKIFTARVAEPDISKKLRIIAAIECWCIEHIGRKLPITNIKDWHMVELWDDRAIQVIPNTGVRAKNMGSPEG